MSYQSRRQAEKRKTRRSRAKEVLVERWTPMARAVTRRTVARAGWMMPTDDHFAAGMVGLMKAITKYDGIRGSAFSTHVWNCVKYEVLSEIRGATYFPTSGGGRGELPKCHITSLDAMHIPNDAGDRDVVYGGATLNPRSLTREAAEALAVYDSSNNRIEEHESLYRALNQLTPIMRETIIEIELNGMTQIELAKKRGVSQPAISFMRDAALKLLREILEKEAR